nr:helix-turn-helix transcriptional regulator [Clostridium sp. YIM B02506]
MSFKNKLQNIRKEKGLSQESIAERIGVSRQAVAKWETGDSYSKGYEETNSCLPCLQ